MLMITKGEMIMGLIKRVIALAMCVPLVMCLNVGAGCSTEAVSDKTPLFDEETGGSVTYKVMGDVTTLSDKLIAEQWALYNDGSFSLKSGQNDFDVYDDPFGIPSLPGEWKDPFDVISQPDFWSDPFSYFFGDDMFGGLFGGLSSGKGSSIVQTDAVAGIDINAGTAWDIYDAKENNRDVIVAVIDTGVDYSHEDLKDSIWINEDEIPDNGIDDDGNGYIDDVYGWNFYDNSNRVFKDSNDDHGTHCAGTIAASTDNSLGVAGVTGGGHVKIMVIKALGGSNGTGETLSVVRAIRYAEANGASIVNLSMGASYSDELLYNTMADSDMLFVVAAGNGSTYYTQGYNTDRTPCYPASYDLDNIISVANISYDGKLGSSSNYGANTVDLAAPGTYIISTTPGNGYGYMTGTSMAAPFVTGAAAMVLSYYDDITLKDVKTILLDSVKKLDSLEGLTVTGGMLDLGAALSYDTTGLSHAEFEKNLQTGSAPELSYTAYVRNVKIYISVTVTDADRDLYGLYYADGELSTADFGFGSNGTEFDLKNSDTANFVTSQYGTYTFYAIDSAGHESVMTVKLVQGEVENYTDTSRQTPGNSGNSNGNGNGYGNGNRYGNGYGYGYGNGYGYGYGNGYGNSYGSILDWFFSGSPFGWYW